MIFSEGESRPLLTLDEETVGAVFEMERLTEVDELGATLLSILPTPLTPPPSGNALLKSATLVEETSERLSKKLVFA